jgi:hypothetical protein
MIPKRLRPHAWEYPDGFGNISAMYQSHLHAKFNFSSQIPSSNMGVYNCCNAPAKQNYDKKLFSSFTSCKDEEIKSTENSKTAKLVTRRTDLKKSIIYTDDW